MGVNVQKNGIVGASNIIEPLGVSLSNPSLSYQYTPTTTTNSTITGQRIQNFELNKTYYVEVTLTWGGGFEATNSNGTFGAWFQGTNYNGASWVWNTNAMTNALNNAVGGRITSTLLGSTSGIKVISAVFDASCTGYDLGVRSDYSNGKGWIKLSNIKVIPYDKYIASGISSCKILNDKIIIKDIIET